MFWKKKTSDNDLVDYDTKNRRETFRLSAGYLEPVYANFGDHIVKMLNISAGGASFESEMCNKGDIKPFNIELHGRDLTSISATAEIVARSDRDICHCKFIQINDVSIERLHQYILYKQVARKRKCRSNKETPDSHG